mgnify:CR=1 FL=1
MSEDEDFRVRPGKVRNRGAGQGRKAQGLVVQVLRVAARSGGELFYADHVCDCREAVSMWVRDYVWTQMIWLPGNMLFLLIWIALAVKLWSGKRSAG